MNEEEDEVYVPQKLSAAIRQELKRIGAEAKPKEDKKEDKDWLDTFIFGDDTEEEEEE